MPTTISRAVYAALHGSTVSDRVRRAVRAAGLAPSSAHAVRV
ncbi:MAG: hypothetical protein AAFX62_16740 [Pseudomonadota bacterium]